MNEAAVRNMLVLLSRSLFDRGYSVGSAGNISVAVDDGLLITPTNSCLGFLEVDRISKLDRTGRHISGDKPSKEIVLHQAFYETRPGTGALVHLHSTYATALSCLPGIDPLDCVASLTPYVVMRVGRVRLLPYVRPGDPAAGTMIRELQGQYAAVLLANHGPLVAARDLSSAVSAAEELEETAKLLILLHERRPRLLTQAQINELDAVFPK
jgi:ribulose-5-phosphate 4-epimerase/fuculose-1-phosphate aldolase